MSSEFDEYFLKKMSPDEEQRFLEGLKSDARKREEFEKAAMAHEVVAVAALKQEIGEISKKYIGKSVSSKSWTSALRIAAIFLVTILGFLGIKESLINGSEWTSDQGLRYRVPNERGDLTPTEQVAQYYKMGDYDKIIHEFGKSSHEGEETAFLVAMSYFNLKKYPEAVENIDKFLQKWPMAQQKSEAEFYLIHSLVGAGKYLKAYDLIEKMNAENQYKAYFDWKYKLRLRLLILTQ
ncbi:MAG: hypothetical protein LCH67_07800 [Bacteroidetes bacterium]|nr:hypothetical protein [Bacteroidota bacterium]